jgi:CubicO group peptidase (beta-lactamase class C family)
MLSVLIANRSGMTMGDFARKHLFKPLKIRDSEWDWWETPSAYGTGDLAIKQSGGFGLFLSPRAMGHIGLSCLNEGKWRGRQVVSKDWISESTSVQINPSPASFYGYLWWLTPSDYFPVEYYQAIGAFGQNIVVIPEFDIVVVITSNELEKTYFYSMPINYVVEYIIQAVLA